MFFWCLWFVRKFGGCVDEFSELSHFQVCDFAWLGRVNLNLCVWPRTYECLPSWELIYPLPALTFESMIFRRSRLVGICDRSLEGTNMNLKASDVSLYHWSIGLHRSRLFHPPFVIHIFCEEASYWSESIQQIHHVGVSKNRGIPQNGWLKNTWNSPIKMGWLWGGKPTIFNFRKHPCVVG